MPSIKKVGDIFWNDVIIDTPYLVKTEKWSRYFKAKTKCSICWYETDKPLNVYKWCSMCRRFWRKVITDWFLCKLELTWWEYTIVDADDLGRVRNHTWYLSKRWNVESRIWKKLIKLHRFIMEYDWEYDIDHIDRNPLNNSRKNLRICTHLQNCHNRWVQKNSKTWIKWVWMTKNWKYATQICVNWEREHIGTFNTIDEAIEAYTKKSLEYHGEFSIMRAWIESPSSSKKAILR